MPIKKKAPPKKPPPQAETPGEFPLRRLTPGAAPVPVPEKQAGRMELRRLAGVLYVTDVINGCTVEQLHRHPMFAEIPPATFGKWAKVDKWGEQRKRFDLILRQRAEKEIADEVMSARRQELTEARDILTDLFKTAKKKKNRPKFKSFEALVNSIVRLGGYTESLRQVIMNTAGFLEAIPPLDGDDQAQQDPSRRIQSQITPEELSAAKAAILRVRREQHRNDHGIEDEKDESLRD